MGSTVAVADRAVHAAATPLALETIGLPNLRRIQPPAAASTHPDRTNKTVVFFPILLCV